MPREKLDPERREVLVVDDDADLRDALIDYLSCVGVVAETARDGVDALEKMRAAWPPCAVLLDLDMPRLDGRGVVGAIRADRALASVPVITMTAGAAPGGIDAHGHLPKPFELGRMLELLFDACRRCDACGSGRPVIGSLFGARQAADLERQ